MTRRTQWVLLALALVAAVLAVYAPVERHEWIAYDDDVYLTANPHVASGLDAREIGWVFTHELNGNYHPLTWLVHMLVVQLFGLEPAAHHLVGVALHALVAVLALLFFGALFGEPWAAALAAALFALHPLRVESVAWAAELKDVLCALFFVGGMLAYIRYGRAPGRARYLVVCVWLVLALASKPMAVSFPLVALLLDVWPLARLGPAAPASEGARPSVRRLLLEKLPLAALAALGAFSTFWAQARAGATSSLGGLALGLRALNALASLAAYLRQSFWPSGLSVYYPHAVHLSGEPARALVVPALAGAALLAALLTLAWRTRRSAPVVGVGLGFFLVTLLPVIGLVQVGTQAHADRYTYLPSLGLVTATVGLARLLFAAHARVLAGAGVALALLLGGLARRQVGFWHDSRTLFEHALALDERNFLAHSKLGEVALAAGDDGAARAEFERTLELNPAHVETLNNLALCLRTEGQLEDAQALLERALALAPLDAQTVLNLGAVELDLGELDSARTRFEAVVRLAPDSPDGPYNLGYLAQLERRLDEAERWFLRALALDPRHVESWSNLGQVRLARGEDAAALEAFEHAAALAPEDALAHFNLGVARRKGGDAAGAAQAFRRALELDPELAPARAALRALGEGGG